LSRLEAWIEKAAPLIGLTGATLAVLVVEGRFSGLADMIWRVGWIGRRIATAIPGGRGAGFDPLPLAND